MVSKHDELDTYLPAFRATVTEANAASVMCAYNSINGQPACANTFLLEEQLRGKWGFKGYVVSDCGAVLDIFKGHQFAKSQPEASAIALEGELLGADGRKIMADEENRAPLARRHVLHLAEAFLLELGVADGQDLVDDQDLGFEMCGNRESKTHVHSRRIVLHRSVKEFFGLGERHDLIKFPRDLPLRI